MANRWTKEQKQAIDARGSDLLIAAAAGSGKTAVLVERIITKLLREGQEIDRLLVVTFTNAAASEMRQRIGVAIAKQLEETPEDIHLQNQMAFLPRADIKTIHAFCLQVIREYYHLFELDPKVRTADPAEIKLLQIASSLLQRNKSSDSCRIVEPFAKFPGITRFTELTL